jgi:sulfur carrier protein ThiS|tara:strand:- start:157 stop:531 length:375 start_codon:yes stop_codon:yes gene_type:complete
MAYATGKYAKAISDRSGMEYPYSEMKKEWNGSFVHRSEYESKHPQLTPRKHRPDPQALKDASPPKKLDPSDQLENGTVSSLLASLGVTSADRKITSTFTSANASPIATALTLSASLGSESVSVS